MTTILTSRETVKKIDESILTHTLPSLDPSQLTNLTSIGVDEVARAKGLDYMTVFYNMETGQLIWVEQGRQAKTLMTFFHQLPKETAMNIKVVAMDMGKAYQKAVRETLPHAAIIFDRFHVMQNYSKVIKNQRRAEFKKANSDNQKLIKGSLYLLLKNGGKLTDKQSLKLDALLNANKNLNLIYMMKEQLQSLWLSSSFEDMSNKLEVWCQLAEESGLSALVRFASSLRAHRVGICHYANYPLTSARIEAGNVAIGMIRKRARGINDTEYFKLKIRQTSIPETHSIFYPKIKLT